MQDPDLIALFVAPLEGAGIPYLKWAMENQQRVLTPAGQISIAPPEYVILHILEFYREGKHQKHLRDISGVINQQDLKLDFLTTATTTLRLQDEWQKALSLAAC